MSKGKGRISPYSFPYSQDVSGRQHLPNIVTQRLAEFSLSGRTSRSLQLLPSTQNSNRQNAE